VGAGLVILLMVGSNVGGVVGSGVTTMIGAGVGTEVVLPPPLVGGPGPGTGSDVGCTMSDEVGVDVVEDAVGAGGGTTDEVVGAAVPVGPWLPVTSVTSS